eukprot:scaffold67163_cov66-Phaeocystis_antarctica.AAC.5
MHTDPGQLAQPAPGGRPTAPPSARHGRFGQRRPGRLGPHGSAHHAGAPAGGDDDRLLPRGCSERGMRTGCHQPDAARVPGCQSRHQQQHIPRRGARLARGRGGGAHSVNSGRAPAGLSAWPWLGIAAPGGPSRPRPTPLPSPLPFLSRGTMSTLDGKLCGSQELHSQELHEVAGGISDRVDSLTELP